MTIFDSLMFFNFSFNMIILARYNPQAKVLGILNSFSKGEEALRRKPLRILVLEKGSYSPQVKSSYLPVLCK